MRGLQEFSQLINVLNRRDRICDPLRTYKIMRLIADLLEESGKPY